MNTHSFSIYSADSGPSPTAVLLHFLLLINCCTMLPKRQEDSSFRMPVNSQIQKAPQFLLDSNHRISCNKELLFWGGYRPIQLLQWCIILLLLLHFYAFFPPLKASRVEHFCYKTQPSILWCQIITKAVLYWFTLYNCHLLKKMFVIVAFCRFLYAFL